jgi:hypothetical protein
MKIGCRLAGIVLAAGCVAAATTAFAADTPKRGGTLTYLIPTDAPPSFDGHREMVYRGGCGSALDDERASPSVTMIGSRSAWPRASRKERSDGAFRRS